MMTTNGNHLDTWLTEAEAAAALGISERSLRRKAAAGEGPEKRDRQRAGLRPEPVYNPDDVARLAVTPPAVFSPSSALTMRPPEVTAQFSAFEQLASLLHNRMLAQARPPARWLTLKQAKEATGLSVTLLRRLIASGGLRALRDGALKVLEADLANLDNLAEIGQIGRISVKGWRRVKLMGKSKQEAGASGVGVSTAKKAVSCAHPKPNCVFCHGAGKLDRGNGTKKPCPCTRRKPAGNTEA